MNEHQTLTVEVKSPWESKTLWLNGLVILAALLVWLVDSQTSGALPFDLDARWLAFILSAVNFALRFATSQPVTGGKP